MAAERAEHEQVQVQVRERARMPLLPPALQGFGGRLAHRVLHGVDVLLGHRVPKGVDVLGHRAAGFWRAPPPRRFVVAGVDGSDAYRAEAEPFTAKRSGTG